MSNILILSAGRRVSLVRGFQEAIRSEGKLNSKIFTADMLPELSAACQISDGTFTLPPVLSSAYPTALLELCRDNNIVLVIPTIDTELPVLAELKNQFLNSGITILVSSIKFIADCADKRSTASLFKSLNLPTPTLFNKNDLSFPILVKPYDGSLSQGVELIHSKNELTAHIFDNPKNIYCQYIDHAEHSEYTVDLYYDKTCQLKCVVPRKRIAVRGGEVAKALAEKNEIVEVMFDSISKLEGAHGCLTLQLFRHNDTAEHWYIEINARFGGGYPLSRLAGADFQKWIIQEYLLNKKISIFKDWKDKTMMLRYDGEVIVNV